MIVRQDAGKVVTLAGVGPSVIGALILASLLWLISLSWTWCQRQDSMVKCLPVWAMLLVCIAIAARMIRVDRCEFDLQGGNFRHLSFSPAGLRRNRCSLAQVSHLASEERLGLSGTKYHRGYHRFYRVVLALDDGSTLELSPYDQNPDLLRAAESLAHLLNLRWQPPAAGSAS